jgi:hypothetical protein
VYAGAVGVGLAGAVGVRLPAGLAQAAIRTASTRGLENGKASPIKCPEFLERDG